MIKALVSDVWHVLFFPKDFEIRGHSDEIAQKIVGKNNPSFFDTYFLNQELLDYFVSIKKQHQLKLALFSSGTMYKEPELQPLLSPIFDKVFSSSAIRYQKNDPASYRYLSEQLNVALSELLFVDDSLRNIEAAREAGGVAIHYHDNQQVMNAIDSVLNR